MERIFLQPLLTQLYLIIIPVEDALRGFAAELSRCAQINPSGAMGASVAREVQNMFWYLRAAADGNPRLTEDAERSLWVARALTGVSVQGITTQQLKPLG